jgi:hypothetical protein
MGGINIVLPSVKNAINSITNTDTNLIITQTGNSVDIELNQNLFSGVVSDINIGDNTTSGRITLQNTTSDIYLISDSLHFVCGQIFSDGGGFNFLPDTTFNVTANDGIQLSVVAGDIYLNPANTVYITAIATSPTGLGTGGVWCDTTGGLNILKIVL